VVTSQPQAPPFITATHAAPAAAPHVTQSAPVLPQWSMLVPSTQLVPSQQPPLQASPPPQLPLHWCVVGSQAWLCGQSAEVAQPQVPPMHALPVPLVVQSVHATPEGPHAVVLVPGWHMPP
jgi:hypothetical protein